MTAPSYRRPTSVFLGLLALAPVAWLGAQAPPAFDSTRAYTHVREQVAFGPRPAGTPANQKTRDYIAKVLGESGYKAVEQTLEATTPVGKGKMTNLIATLAGERPERILGASHFDTKPVNEFRF